MLVIGAGPIGLLAALLGMQRGLEVHVLDRAESGPKPEIVRALGATYHTGTVKSVGFEPDVLVECTCVGQVIQDSIQGTGVRWHRLSHGCRDRWSCGRSRGAAAVLKNNVVVGSVNANRRH